MSSKFWHVCYVKPKTEKIVHQKIEELGFEVFLPLIKHQRIYKTSKKEVNLPLFTGYIFVNIESGYRHHITSVNEVYRFIKFKDEYAKVSDYEVANLKLFINGINKYEQLESDFIFQQGKYVEIINGPFKGMRGKMVEKYGKKRVSIRIEALKQELSVEIESKFIKGIEI